MQADELAKRKAIIDACLEMNRSGLNQGTSGNISVRHGEGLLITPTAMAYGSLEPEDIVYLAMDGTATGRHKPSSEWRFHRDILAARPETNAVVHAHPLACTTLAILNRPIPAVHYMIAAAGGPTVRVAPYAIYGSEELSQHAVAALEGRFACLLEHHGMIAIGPTLARTMWIAEEVETLAKQYLGCLQLGEVRLLSDEQIAAVVEKFAGYGLRA
ncbi:L-fuculose-phosphate aldolase [Rhodobacter sp. CZR27]|uniref:L-fuculose-phosphate aldolase n=1 Tax=Rhodobacter sp. CZR27 TaxID=2033869 RepID=UPI000BBF270D|nr:L-fuculose-phosphate aldolase [Rhodobacter sp. CZR27]